MKRNWIRWFMKPETRVKFAWTQLIVALTGWPISLLIFAKDEPPFILSLSWYAIAITAWDVVCTSDVRRAQENEED